jgi:hypothetical protein
MPPGSIGAMLRRFPQSVCHWSRLQRRTDRGSAERRLRILSARLAGREIRQWTESTIHPSSFFFVVQSASPRRSFFTELGVLR